MGASTPTPRFGAQAGYALLGDGRRAKELLDIINPIRHAQDEAGVNRYRVEPYVVASDVYSVPPHVGRGGWTWYTGSAAWLYRIVLEMIVGLKCEDDRLTICPCVPSDWSEFEVVYRFRSTTYRIVVQNPHRLESAAVVLRLDGQELVSPQLRLIDNGGRPKCTPQWCPGRVVALSRSADLEQPSHLEVADRHRGLLETISSVYSRPTARAGAGAHARRRRAPHQERLLAAHRSRREYRCEGSACRVCSPRPAKAPKEKPGVDLTCGCSSPRKACPDMYSWCQSGLGRALAVFGTARGVLHKNSSAVVSRFFHRPVV